MKIFRKLRLSLLGPITVEKLHLDPDDITVIIYKHKLLPVEKERIKKQIGWLFSGKIIILDQGCDIKVLHPWRSLNLDEFDHMVADSIKRNLRHGTMNARDFS